MKIAAHCFCYCCCLTSEVISAALVFVPDKMVLISYIECICRMFDGLKYKSMLTVASLLKTAVHVALLLWHSIKESRVRTLFNRTLCNGALVETDIPLTACSSSSSSSIFIDEHDKLITLILIN